MNTMKIFGMVAVALGTMVSFANSKGGNISATLFDGQGNKEVLAEAVHTPREPAPAPQQAPEQPKQDRVVMSEKDSTGKTIRTVEQKGDTTVVKDGHDRVIQSSTRNADGSVTVRDGHGTVRETINN